IVSIGAAASHLPLVVGQDVVAGPRSTDGLHWTLRSADGLSVELDHDAADAVVVRLDPTPVRPPGPASTSR
ncbi:MAG TPA: hypothetical protein PLV92_05345, partial [Pirellulaceae bacterium]|nr:hypothetical protein [Pirellulaceae bacterium]